jgi:hypothetical protein
LIHNHPDFRSAGGDGLSSVEFEEQENAKVAVTYLDNAEIDGRYLSAELARFDGCAPDQRESKHLRMRSPLLDISMSDVEQITPNLSEEAVIELSCCCFGSSADASSANGA